MIRRQLYQMKIVNSISGHGFSMGLSAFEEGQHARDCSAGEEGFPFQRNMLALLQLLGNISYALLRD
jgi:hypothetical protein